MRPAAPPALESLLSAGPVAAMALRPPTALTVLIADDDPVSRSRLQERVTTLGHRAVAAATGAAALEAFLRERPDVVLLDADAGAQGPPATADLLRALSGDGFVPVVLLLEDAHLSLAQNGAGCDVLTKPVDMALLDAKLQGFQRMQRLLEAMRRQRDELARHNQWLRREYQVAEAVFGQVMHSEALRSPQVRCLVSPQAVFNGDLVVAAWRPSGELQVMVGDFTGHGLSAAVGAIPVADIFHGMTAKGFPIPEIVAEINQKLQRILPRGLFLAAVLLELDAAANRLSVWNGGMPDVVVTAGDRQPVLARVPSFSFPLGMVETAALDCVPRQVEIAPAHRVFVHTDGLTETPNSRGERFGEARLAACFGQAHDALPTFDRILSALHDFRGPCAQADDVTLVELVADPAMRKPATIASGVGAVAPRAASPWRASFTFGIDTLKAYDPLPSLMQFVLDTQRLHRHKQRIYMVLAELFTNALEHGLLGLDSAIKGRSNGFSEYYQEKERRLREAATGEIKVELEHTADGAGGRLVIRVEDTGPGFDHAARLSVADSQTAPGGTYFGRGIAAVRALCAELRYHGAGNRAEAVYVWGVEREDD